MTTQNYMVLKAQIRGGQVAVIDSTGNIIKAYVMRDGVVKRLLRWANRKRVNLSNVYDGRIWL